MSNTINIAVDEVRMVLLEALVVIDEPFRQHFPNMNFDAKPELRDKIISLEADGHGEASVGELFAIVAKLSLAPDEVENLIDTKLNAAAFTIGAISVMMTETHLGELGQAQSDADCPNCLADPPNVGENANMGGDHPTINDSVNAL
ncbi:MAG: hypothetical protein RIQ56_41 [Candidatus Parcubacteria bacterium]